MSLEKSIKSNKEQLYEGVLIRLSNLMADESIATDKYAGVRQALGSIYAKLNNNFDTSGNNKEIIESVLNKLTILTDSNPELKEKEFDTFRHGLGKIIEIINNDLQ